MRLALINRRTLSGRTADLTVGDLARLIDGLTDDQAKVTVKIDAGDQREPSTITISVIGDES